MATLATLITQLRTLSRDLPTSNRSMGETPKLINDGVNTHFRLQHPILITGQLWWSSAGTYRSQTGVTVDDANLALITISPAPPIGTQNAPFYIDYYFTWFADSDYTEFLNDSARDCVGSGDPTTVIDGLVSALMQYGLGHFWQARASQYAHRYSSTGGQAGQSIEKVTENYNKMADSAFKKAKEMRDDYYEDLGSRQQSVSAIINYPIDPMTPRR